MLTRESFDPTLHAFLVYYLGFCLRYGVTAGAAFWILHVAFRDFWAAYRIQREFPPVRQIGFEIRWSLVNTAVSGFSTMLMYVCIHNGWSSMYFDATARGWLYFGLSILLCIVGYDTWIYWQHRWLHTPWLFRHVHSLHHRVANPTVFAAFAQHPGETLMGNVYFALFVLFVPIHPWAMAVAGAYMFFIGVLAHSGYEFYPSGFTRHPILGWINTSTHHNMHHRHVGCNYGNWFNCWDTLMGTNHPEYHDTFDATRQRVAAQARSPFSWLTGERSGAR